MHEAPGYLELLRRNVDYRRLWLGQVVSFFGDWFKTIALLTIVQQTTESTTMVALVMIAKMLPIFLVSPIAGPLIDRFDRRVLMLATDLIRAGLTLALVAAYWWDSLALLFLALFLLVACTGVFIPARSAVVPMLTRPEELPVAMALASGTWSVTLALGAAAGGLVTHFVGVENALYLDGFTYLVSFAFLWRLPPLKPSSDASRSATFRDGLAYLKERPYLTVLLSQKTMLSLSGASIVMLPIYGNGLYPETSGPGFVGLLYAVRGFGSLLGSMGMRRLTGDAPEAMRRCLAPSFVAMAAGVALSAWAPSMASAAVGYFLGGLGLGVAWVMAETLSQYASDSEYRGRIYALDWGFFTLVSSAVSLGAGLLCDQYGWSPRDVMYATAALTLLPAGVWSAALALLRVEGHGRVALQPNPGTTTSKQPNTA